MYDELIKRLRESKNEQCYIGCFGNCGDCKIDAELEQAADAIEELGREAEEYKAAYRKEHKKRIAENRYLYDELTKAVKEKLLTTPMRIEVPEPPKEEST